MDKIFVDDDSLEKTMHLLTELHNSVLRITEQLRSSCYPELPDLDEALRRDVAAFLQAAETYEDRIGGYVDRNNQAIGDRIRKLAVYSDL